MYNARYYDPNIGQFVCPDTIVPDPENVLAYNRYMCTLGNPLKLVDPSGHETSKPPSYPDWLMYPLDLPVGLSIDDLTTGVVENNVPTVFGAQVNFFGGGGVGIGGSMSGGGGWLFNWYSGELAYTTQSSAAGRGGMPEAGGSVTLNVVTASGSSSLEGVFGASTMTSADGDLELGGKVTAQVSWGRSWRSQDSNGNGQFDLMDENGMSEPLTSPYLDPQFGRTVDSLSIGGGGEFNMLSISPVSGGLSRGLSDTDRQGRVLDVYAPVRRILTTMFGLK